MWPNREIGMGYLPLLRGEPELDKNGVDCCWQTVKGINSFHARANSWWNLYHLKFYLWIYRRRSSVPPPVLRSELLLITIIRMFVLVLHHHHLYFIGISLSKGFSRGNFIAFAIDFDCFLAIKIYLIVLCLINLSKVPFVVICTCWRTYLIVGQ